MKDTVESLEKAVAAYRKPFLDYEAAKASGKHYFGLRWNWDDDYDGLLVLRAQQLAYAGFEIVEIYRKQKIRMKNVNKFTTREIFDTILLVAGDSITGISIKSGVWAWWGKTTGSRRY